MITACYMHFNNIYLVFLLIVGIYSLWNNIFVV